MPLVSATGLSKHFGTQLCFEDVAFALEEGDRIALIGANGSGKTTLFRILLGEVEHDTGTVSRQKGLRIGVLEQDPKLPAGATLRQAVLDASPSGRLELEMAALYERIEKEGDPDGRLLAQAGEKEALFQQAGGYAVDSLAERILDGFQMPAARHGEKVDTLSGGERSRLALARLLLSAPDLWLLDEPTNHLDLDGIAFLEEFLAECRASVLVVSHDRHFLDAVTSKTWEIEGQRLWAYPAPYTRAKALREERIKAARRAYEIQRDMISSQEEYIRRYGAGQRARQAKGRKTRLARVVRLEDPENQARAMALNLPTGEPLGARPPLEVRDLSVDYGSGPLFKDLTFALEPGETLGIVGPNGAGKTSLLKMLTGELAPRTGKVAWGVKAEKGVLTQHESFPEEATTPFRYLRNHEVHRTNQELRATLGAMCFGGESADKPLSALSGGERKRLMLTRLLLEGNNVLLLDEPTNHLDLPSREALEFALSLYEGSLIVISHDRYLLDQLADRVLWIQDGRWAITNGGFAEALSARRKAPQALPKAPPAKPKPAPAQSKYAGLSTAELEKRIIQLEEKLRAEEDPALRARLEALESEYRARA